ALHLGQGAEEGQDETARRALGGDALLGEGDGRSGRLHALYEAEEVARRARAPVDLRHEHAVAGLEGGEQARAFGALSERDGAGRRAVDVLGDLARRCTT